MRSPPRFRRSKRRGPRTVAGASVHRRRGQVMRTVPRHRNPHRRRPITPTPSGSTRTSRTTRRTRTTRRRRARSSARSRSRRGTTPRYPGPRTSASGTASSAARASARARAGARSARTRARTVASSTARGATARSRTARVRTRGRERGASRRVVPFVLGSPLRPRGGALCCPAARSSVP